MLYTDIMTDFCLASVLSSVFFIVPLSLLPVLPLFFSVSNYFLFSFCLYFLLSIHSCPYYHLCSARLLPAIHLFLLSILLYPYLLLLSCPYISQLLQAILLLFFLLSYCYSYLLLAEFSVRTVNYEPSFFDGKKRGSVIYSSDRKNDANKMFIIWLLPVWGTGNKFRTHDLTVIFKSARKQ